uniref:Plexin TIG domain-containing protein n=1 Tax=Anopheles atroparvus TaxID=41427 RepID=A0A182J911_ANOAO
MKSDSLLDRNLGYISGAINDGKCPVAGSLGNIFSFCHVGLKFSGVTPVFAPVRFPIALASIAVSNIGPHTIAFVDSNDGWIWKVLLSGREEGEYERLEGDLDWMTILPYTLFAPTNNHLCAAGVRWRNAAPLGRPARKTPLPPDRVPIGQMSVVRIVIKTLPELPHNAQYRCVFGNATPIYANVLKEGLLCMISPANERPTTGDGLDHILVPMSVRSSETNKDFVSRSLAFYDCSRHDFLPEVLAALAAKNCRLMRKMMEQLVSTVAAVTVIQQDGQQSSIVGFQLIRDEYFECTEGKFNMFMLMESDEIIY